MVEDGKKKLKIVDVALLWLRQCRCSRQVAARRCQQYRDMERRNNVPGSDATSGALPHHAHKAGGLYVWALDTRATRAVEEHKHIHCLFLSPSWRGRSASLENRSGLARLLSRVSFSRERDTCETLSCLSTILQLKIELKFLLYIKINPIYK